MNTKVMAVMGRAIIILGVCILAASIFVVYLNHVKIPVYGEKQEEGVKVAYGTVIDAFSVHGFDWQIKLDSSPYVFVFEPFEVSSENVPRPGAKVVLAYEWQLRCFRNECPDEHGSYNPRYCWAPVILDWERYEK